MGLIKLRSSGAVDMSFDEGRRLVRFGDSVAFDYGAYDLVAGRLTLDEAVGRAWAEGDVKLSGPAGRARATKVWLDLATERIVLEDLEANVGLWSARAKNAEILGDRIVLNHALVTLCPAPHPLYSLRVRRMSKESRTRYVAHGVVPYFYFVPFFYLPWYTYELEETEEGGPLVPSRQGFEFNPGRGNFTGLFVKTSWRKKFFDRQLLSVSRLDYYSKPGLALGQEMHFKSRTAEHFTFLYYIRQRVINRNNFSRADGRDSRWRLWQVWNKNFSFGHFKSFVNEVSDSHLEDDYRFNLDERRLPEREINAEFVYDRPQFRMKVLGERLRTLNLHGAEEYRVERRRAPALRFLTFPFLILSGNAAPDRRGWAFYGQAEGLGGRGRDRFDRPDGAFGDGRMAALFSVPLTAALSATSELGAQTEFRRNRIAGESSSTTPAGNFRLTLHRPWWGGDIQSDAGFTYRRAFANKSVYSSGGVIEDLLFVSLRRFRPRWKTSLDAGYDFRPALRGLSTVDFQTRWGDDRREVSSIVRYDPQKSRTQSVYTNAWFKIGDVLHAGMGFQTVQTDTEIQVQFTPTATFETPGKKYRIGLNAFYDAKLKKWRTTDLRLGRTFDCVEITLRLSKRDNDFRFSFSFDLAGFGQPQDLFRQEDALK
ncbi:MAG: hypothetical protein A3G34_02360 [Candidatus Lindowbacteria bacterium RIFCSPLOWO2_12_FULL_62_27]|nr:MAG: hypothetical protein A3G34_02360 [Candidatus Lindowbacteria bacterium RIFCSPLOWO2_12_FULL_62_27]